MYRAWCQTSLRKKLLSQFFFISTGKKFHGSITWVNYMGEQLNFIWFPLKENIYLWSYNIKNIKIAFPLISAGHQVSSDHCVKSFQIRSFSTPYFPAF